MIRFLQFSDIHFLFCEETEDDYAQMRIRFIEDLENVKQQFGPIDHVLICGDIACKGQKEEFNKAREFIDAVSNVLEVNGKRPNVFVVPGNHDINRKSYEATRNLLRPVLLDKKNNNKLNNKIKLNYLKLSYIYNLTGIPLLLRYCFKSFISISL